MRGLKDRAFVVTGAGSGIGAATTLRLLDEAALVVAADINKEGLERTASAAGENKCALTTIPFDLANEVSIVNMVACASKHFGRIDGVVNVAADVSRQTMTNDHDIEKLDAKIWAHVLQVNLIGTGIVVREAIPHMAAAGGGSIVNISSLAAWTGEAFPAYSSSKIALHALTRHIARAWGKKNIRCNSIAPGLVLTEASTSWMQKEFLDQMLAKTCLPRLGQPEDLAASVAFLLSYEASWISGQIISVDGGVALRE